jgi:hypothetical protein
MTQLELQQRGLLDLLKKRGAPPVDPYLRRVEGSRELAMVREIALWWRSFQLEAQCRLTSRLLKRLNCFDALVAAYFYNNATSPFVEELSHGFLDFLSEHPDGLVRTMAQFEYAVLQTRSGSASGFEIVWDRHPDQVVLALENGSELPPAETDCCYRMQIGRELPHMISCTQECSFPPRSPKDLPYDASSRADVASSRLTPGKSSRNSFNDRPCSK